MSEDTTISVAVLTVSDTCSAGKAVDLSGPAISSWIDNNTRFKGKVSVKKCVPDEQKDIEGALIELCDLKSDLVLTTGGTGFAERDVTPEATKAVLEKEAPGMVTAIIQGSLQITPMAMLSRPACGVRGNTLIINLPGSKKGALECLEIVGPALPHAFDLLRGNTESIKDLHQSIQQNKQVDSTYHHCSHHQHADNNVDSDISKVARRMRKSPYPALSVQDALNIVLNAAVLLRKERVSYLDALDRILGEDIFAADPLPPFPASIKDGYAVIASDGPGVRKVIGDSIAGTVPSKANLKSGCCMRINTGAPVPAGADAVVQVEDTKLISEMDEGRTELEVEILTTPSPGNDIRPIGSDIAKGEKVLCCGSKLGYSELGILATVGATEIQVYKLPVVGILSTGNELIDPGEPLLPGKIRDSNKAVLISLFKEHGFPVIDLGIAEDRIDSLVSKLSLGLQQAHVLVSTGGVSMGDKDLLKPVLKQYFSTVLHFGRVLMKPGLPTTFLSATYENEPKLIFGLPGNPVSAAVTCNLFVVPAVRKMSGYSQPNQSIIRVKLASAINLDPRPEYQRVKLHREPHDSVLTASVVGSQISCRLLSMANANGLLVLPARTEAKSSFSEGEEVDCIVIGRI